MKTIASVILQPTAITRHPIRYFLFVFLMGVGLVHLASEVLAAFFNGIFTDGPRTTLMVFALSILISISRYFEQKKRGNGYL